MRGLIPCGGAGTRLRPITHTSAKQLVPVANKPILFYGLEAMADAGISAVGTGERFGIDVTYIRQDAPRGLAHCVLIARDFLGDESFVMYLGDNLLQQGLTGLVKVFSEQYGRRAGSAAAHILLAPVSDPQSFGV